MCRMLKEPDRGWKQATEPLLCSLYWAAKPPEWEMIRGSRLRVGSEERDALLGEAWLRECGC